MKRVLSACVLSVVVAWGGICLEAAGNRAVVSAQGVDAVVLPSALPYLAANSQARTQYRHNGDGTVTDLRSGLIWQQADDGQRRTWQAAVDYCADLNLGGYGDWRLPTRRELYSIRKDSAKPLFQAVHCWSGSSLSTDGQIAWVVLVGHGYVYQRNKDDHYFVRCVR